MNRLDELLQKRKNNLTNIYEEEELIELVNKLPQTEKDKIDPALLKYSLHEKHDALMEALEKLNKLLDKRS